MDAGTYQPQPIDTSHVTLSEDLASLTERLSENAHDLWARERLLQGWKYGAKRDDAAKTHPCLIGYDELSEAERRFDRETAMGTLKAILALGYAIHSPAGQHDMI